MKGPLFYSKILLFGEYGIIKDSKGLSIPYNFYKGALKVDENPTDEAIKSNKSLERFAAHLEQLQKEHLRHMQKLILQKSHKRFLWLLTKERKCHSLLHY